MIAPPRTNLARTGGSAEAVLTEPLLPDKGKIVARGPGLGLANMHFSDVGPKIDA